MLTMDQARELHQALLVSFTPDEFRRLVEERIGVKLNRIVSVHSDMTSRTFEVIQMAERAGWTADLVKAAYESKPSNVQLTKVYDALGLAPEVDYQTSGASELLRSPFDSGATWERKIIAQSQVLPDFGAFRQRLTEIEARVCRVEVAGQGQSTGFLIGPDAVLTFSFGFENPKKYPKRIGCRFDSRSLVDGTVVEGVLAELAREWLIDVSPMEDLGYALLRLKRPIGNERLGVDRTDGVRGWLTLPDNPVTVKPQSSVTVAFQAAFGSLKIAIDSTGVIGLSRGDTHVRYKIVTSLGSAGAPCFTSDFQVFAIHQSANISSGEGEGVLAYVVRERLIANGHAEALGGSTPVASEPAFQPQVATVSTPPPKPPAIVTADDLQKNRWGGKAKNGGRSLSAINLDVGKRDFSFDALVESTDGSSIEGPVIFHLHDTFAKGVIWVRKIENNQALLKGVEAFGAFTIGVQVKDKDGKWISLEYDLLKLRGLPKRFHSI